MSRELLGPKHIVNMIQLRNREIPGIESAPDYDNYPGSDIPQAEMPIILTVPVNGSWQQATFEASRHQRTYRLLVLVSGATQGLDNESESKVLDLIAEIGRYWVASERHLFQAMTSDQPEVAMFTGQGQGVQGQITDTGYESFINWKGESYQGTEFRLTVFEKG